MCLHPSVSLNNEKNYREISKDKIGVGEKTAGLWSGNSSDLDSACLKALVPVEIFQFSDMHYESRFLDTFRGHNIRPRAGQCKIQRNIAKIAKPTIKPPLKQRHKLARLDQVKSYMKSARIKKCYFCLPSLKILWMIHTDG